VWLAPRLPGWGILLSWTVPAALLLVPINALIFRRLIPRHVEQLADASEPIRRTELRKYVASNYVGSLFSLVSGRLLPVLVVAVAGATSAAYFYLAWTIANTLRLVTVQMTTSLTVEGALDRARVGLNSARFLRLMLGLLVPTVGLMAIGAPLILRLSGPEYAAQGAPLLRWLSLSILPGVVVSWFVSLARIRHAYTQIWAVEGGLALLTLGLSYLLLDLHGVTGVGVAALVSNSLVALALLLRSRQTTRPAPALSEAGLD
jgi:O-antigen/teichoic acid export membrane protein